VLLALLVLLVYSVGFRSLHRSATRGEQERIITDIQTQLENLKQTRAEIEAYDNDIANLKKNISDLVAADISMRREWEMLKEHADDDKAEIAKENQSTNPNQDKLKKLQDDRTKTEDALSLKRLEIDSNTDELQTARASLRQQQVGRQALAAQLLRIKASLAGQQDKLAATESSAKAEE
jgi:chromosome segregation ATPase